MGRACPSCGRDNDPGGEEGGRLAAAALTTYESLGAVVAADRLRG